MKSDDGSLRFSLKNILYNAQITMTKIETLGWDEQEIEGETRNRGRIS